MSDDFATRFWSKADRSGQCWLWTASTDRHGYAQVRTGGRTRSAHRVAYEITVGPIPDGLELDHLCRVRHCVNPAHLEPVTHAENSRRGGAAKTHCKHGHEFTPENTRITDGKRVCRACTRLRCAKYQAKKRSE